uniref:LEM domain-containing protein n=1 Tax=Lepisosteus oculatus TaxID=7918 RepID=W5NEF6_LEPOC
GLTARGQLRAIIVKKATKKTDKPRPEDVDVADLTDEDLKDQLLKYGVSVGPIVASTRKLYEKKLQKLLDQGPPETLPPPSAPLRAADANQNGNTDSEKYSDNEEDEKLEPIVEKLEPVKTRVKTTPGLRTRRYEHNRSFNPTGKRGTEFTGGSAKPLFPLLPHSERPSRRLPAGRPEAERNFAVEAPLVDDSSLLTAPVPGCGHTWMSVPRRMRDIAHRAMSSPVSLSLPLLSHSRLPPLSPQVEERLEAGDVVRRKEAKDLLEEMFPYEPRTPTGITATCRRPIHGAAGRPLNPSDFRLDDSILRRTEFSAAKLTAPSGGQSRSRRSLPVWLQLLLLMAVAGFLFFVYQAMETNEINPFSTMVSPASPS